MLPRTPSRALTEKYDKFVEIGSGTYGVVYKAIRKVGSVFFMLQALNYS
jgi:serine/threonine protein kinase